MQEDKERQPEQRKTKSIKGGKHRSKRRKTEANTPQASNPPNHSRTQKPHKPRKAPRQYKPTQQPQNPLKTPLKCEIEPYFKPMHREQSKRADKREGTHGQRTRASIRQVLKPRSPAPPAPSGHAKRQARNAPPALTLHPLFKNILVFRPFWSPIFPRKHRSAPKKI